MLFISQNPLKLAQSQELNKSKYSCPANNRMNANAMLSSNFTFNSQSSSQSQKHINTLLMGSRQEIDSSLNKFDKFKMNQSSFKPFSSTNNALTLQMQPQAKQENGSSLFSNGYTFKQNSRIYPKIAQKINTPFQRYSQHAFLQKIQLQSNRASGVNETSAQEDEHYSIHIQKNNQEKSQELFQKIENNIDEQVKWLLDSENLLSPESLWFLVSQKIHFLLFEPQYKYINKEWHEDIQKMAEQYCQQRIEILSKQLHQKMKSPEFLYEVHQKVQQKKKDIRQKYYDYMHENRNAQVDHLFQGDALNEVMLEVQFQASEIIINLSNSQFQHEQSCVNLALDFFKNCIDNNQLYKNGANFQDALKELEEDENFLYHKSQIIEKIKKNMSTIQYVDRMLKQTPKIQGKTLEMWQKLEMMRPIHDALIKGIEQTSQQGSHYIDKDEQVYYGHEISANQIIYGQRKKSTHEFYGVVRKIDIEKNSIYEGQYQNQMAKGYGRLIQADGSFYIGHFQSDEPPFVLSF